MKIRESQIRRLVCEEIKRMNEMPYGGNLGTVKGSDEPSTSGFSDSYGENRPGAEKFARSGRFEKLAQKQFGQIDNNVFVAPYVGDIEGLTDTSTGDASLTRIKVSNLKSGTRTLKKYGFSIPENLDPGSDTVILYSTNTAAKGIIATPWMLIHSIFDSDYEYKRLAPSWYKFVYAVSEDFERKKYAIGGDHGFDEGYDWSSLLTMKSARDGGIETQADAYAEIMCQQILATDRFQIAFSKATNVKLAKCAKDLESLKPFVARGADEFLSNIKGKLIILAVN